MKTVMDKAEQALQSGAEADVINVASCREALPQLEAVGLRMKYFCSPNVALRIFSNSAYYLGRIQE